MYMNGKQFSSQNKLGCEARAELSFIGNVMLEIASRTELLLDD